MRLDGVYPVHVPVSHRLRPPRCVSTGPVVVRLAVMANERERERVPVSRPGEIVGRREPLSAALAFSLLVSACSPSRALCYHFSSRQSCCLHRQLRALALLHA